MSVEVMRCPLCGGSRLGPFEEYEDAGRTLHYRICDTCGLVCQSPRMSDEELARFYVSEYRQTVQGSEGPTEKDLRIQAGRARHLGAFCGASLQGVSRHLDIGSSSGALLREFARVYGCQGAGIEPGEAYRKILRAQGWEVFPKLEELGETRRRSFDVISIIHVLEHIPDPVGYLRGLRDSWLAPGGWLLVETPNLFGHRSLELAHLTVFSPRTLRQTLQMAGFEVRKVRAHGRPRSPILPLYLSALARADRSGQPARPRFSSAGVRLRRRWALWRLETLTRRLPNWTWRELPEMDEAGGPIAR
jgi:2-polyprenyl-3-methyl-5-hydroxy-6-metoxy-1,4-benzoquinol methylase